MKKEIKGFILGVICTLMFTSIATFAASRVRTIDVYENNVSIYANNNFVAAPNFTYNDTTYVPLRAVLEQMNCSLYYDEQSKTVSAFNNLMDIDLSVVTDKGDEFDVVMVKKDDNGYYTTYVQMNSLFHTSSPLYLYDPSDNSKTPFNSLDNYSNSSLMDDFIAEHKDYDWDFPWHLYSYDGKTYLGKLTLNTNDIDSIWNEFGEYGNNYSGTSIWNEYGLYGSVNSPASAFNPYATRPPVIYSNDGTFMGYLSKNKYLDNISLDIISLQRFLYDFEK